MNEAILKELPQPKKKKAVIASLEPGVEALLTQLGSADWQTRVQSAELLGEIQEPALVQRLIQNLGATDFRMRRAAAEALGHMGAF